MLEPLYIDPPYSDFAELLRSFGKAVTAATPPSEPSNAEGSSSESGLWHLSNIVGTFDALSEVFEKQTKSPSIKSLYELRDLVKAGNFVLQVDSNGRTAGRPHVQT